MKNKEEMDNLDEAVIQKLQVLRAEYPRSATQAAASRENFMKQARLFRDTVSASRDERHKGWILTIQNLWKRKEYRMAAILSLAILFFVVLGGSGTVYAAQTSMPDEFLYPVKLWSEDLRLDLSLSPEQQLQLNLAFADRRVEEIRAAFDEGTFPGEEVQVRLQTHLSEALRLAAAQDDPNAALQQVRLRIEQQLRILEQTGAANAQGEQTRQQIQQMLQERLEQNQTAEPLQQQNQVQQQNMTSQPDQAGGAGNGGFQQGSPTDQTSPGTGAGNPWTTSTPTPNSGYGPGPGTDGTPIYAGTPGSGQNGSGSPDNGGGGKP